MFTVKNLTITNNTGKQLIESFNFVINSNQKIAIIGEEGNGKSTLMKILLGHSLNYVSYNGAIENHNERIGYLSQVLDSSWNTSTPYEYCLKENADDEIAFEKYNELKNIQKLCIQLHLPLDFIERETLIQNLSGGEKVKLQLLKLLIQPVTLLFLDEPTNDLDIETLEWLENFLVETKLGVLFISHDETLLEKCATDILLLEQVNKKTKVRHTFYHGSYSSFRIFRENKLDKEEQVANKEKEEYLEKQRKLHDIMNSVHHYQKTITRQNPAKGRLLKKKMHALKSMEKRFEKEGYTKLDTLEEAIDVYFDPFEWNSQKTICDIHYDQISIHDQLLIQDINLFIKGKEKVVLIGNNGCGKTTLLNQIYNDLKQREDIKIGYMPQNYSLLMSEDETPLSFLAPSQTKESITKAREMLARMKFTRDEMIQNIQYCSEGQKAKIFILKFILDQCNVLILDEPTRNLSPLSNPVLREILVDFNGAILSVSHDRKYIDEVCDKVFKIENKSFIEIRSKSNYD